MQWGRLRRNLPRSKYARDEWASYYQSVTGRRPAMPRSAGRKGRSGLFRITAVLVILAVLVVARQFPAPAGEQVRENLRYLLTAEWNFRPILDKSLQLAAQLVNWEDPAVQEAPGKIDTAKPVAGQGLEQEELVIPVSGKVISEFGWIRSNVDDMERFHPGIDIGAPAGSGVVAALGGRVTKIDSDSTLGRYILIDHGGGTYTLYGGVSGIAVVEGQEVKAGQEIAKVGEGEVAGGGLHFELRENGKLVDPLARLQLNEN